MSKATPESYLRRLSAALAAEDWPTAERLLREKARKKDAPAALLYNLAQVLVRSGKAAQAGAWYERATNADPRHSDAWCEYGAWRAERGDMTGALECFDRALRLAPGDRDARRGAARARLRLGEWSAAAAHWEALDPSGEDGEAALARLRIALETGAPEAASLRRRIYATPSLRPALLKTLTRTARGRLPLKPSALGAATTDQERT